MQAEIHHNAGDALVSHELLASLTQDRARAFVECLDATEVHVLLTVRDLARVIPSRWQEATQNRLTVPWPDYLQAICEGDDSDRSYRHFWRQADVGRVLHTWKDIVPIERTRVITTPRPAAPPGELWRRFASVIGADPALSEGSRPEELRTNASLGVVSSELMRRMNERVSDLDWPEYRLGFKRGLAKRGLSGRAWKESSLRLPADRLAWVEHHTQSLIDDIKRIGPEVVGDLEELVPAPSESVSDGSGQPSDPELLEAAMDGLDTMGRQLAQTRLELRKEHIAATQPQQLSRRVLKLRPVSLAKRIRQRWTDRRTRARWRRSL